MSATMHDSSHDTPHVHVSSPLSLLAVFGTLVALTILTVVAAEFVSNSWEAYVSIAIASAKAALVALYFMHLRYEKPFNVIVFLVALISVGVFLAFSLADSAAYQETIIRSGG